MKTANKPRNYDIFVVPQKVYQLFDVICSVMTEQELLDFLKNRAVQDRDIFTFYHIYIPTMLRSGYPNAALYVMNQLQLTLEKLKQFGMYERRLEEWCGSILQAKSVSGKIDGLQILKTHYQLQVIKEELYNRADAVTQNWIQQNEIVIK